jgi:hypothetical protein
LKKIVIQYSNVDFDVTKLQMYIRNHKTKVAEMEKDNKQYIRKQQLYSSLITRKTTIDKRMKSRINCKIYDELKKNIRIFKNDFYEYTNLGGKVYNFLEFTHKIDDFLYRFKNRCN